MAKAAIGGFVVVGFRLTIFDLHHVYIKHGIADIDLAFILQLPQIEFLGKGEHALYIFINVDVSSVWILPFVV